jgi:glutamyl-tRNA reductase
VLVVGAGEAGRLAAEALAAQGPGELIVTNRTPGRAEQLAHSLGGITVPFEDLHDAIRGADVVVGATGAPDPLVTTEDVARITESRAGRPLLIVDIGVPRDFPGAVQHLDGVEYHDLDALQSVTGRNNEARRSEIEAVESLIDIEVTNFQEWWDQLQIVPTITALRDRADALRRGEVAKTLRRLRVDPEDREQVEQLIDVLSRSIVNQVLADPIAVLRERGDRDTYVDATRTLFRLHDRHDG